MKRRDLTEAIFITIVPVAIALFMQKPALRQAFAMRTAHYGKLFCQAQADFWWRLADTCATAYQKARL